MLRASYTAVVERNVLIDGRFESEPYECGWATEAILFARVLSGDLSDVVFKVQISPDGMRWCDEGSILKLPACEGTSFVKIRHFGNWLRVAGTSNGKSGKLILTLHLKE